VTELHVHDWTSWHPLAVIEGVQWRRRICPGCASTEDEPTPSGDQPAPKDAAMESAIEAAAKVLYADSGGILEDRWTYCIPQAERILAAAVPHIERAARAAAFTEAADEVHREALWQKESQMRGMFANGEMSVDRLAMLEDILRSFADLAVARGGEATE
jgi:hypothetical protein